MLVEWSQGLVRVFRSLLISRRCGKALTASGVYHSLSVIISQFKPNVVCRLPGRRPATLDSCQHLLNRMPVTTALQVFGKDGSAGVAIPLPQDLFDCESSTSGFEDAELKDTAATFRCDIQIDVQGPPQYTNWYSIWTAAVAAVGMCVTRDYDGEAIIDRTIIQTPFEGRNQRADRVASTNHKIFY